MTYKNPLAINNIGDPFVLKASDSRYYCYPTSGGVRGFKVWTSTDLVNWVDKGLFTKQMKIPGATTDFGLLR